MTDYLSEGMYLGNNTLEFLKGFSRAITSSWTFVKFIADVTSAHLQKSTKIRQSNTVSYSSPTHLQ